MHIHGDNLRQKEDGDRKYADAKSKKLLRQRRSLKLQSQGLESQRRAPNPNRKKMQSDRIKAAVVELLLAIGEDPNRKE